MNSKDKKCPEIFIVSSGRSGSTLLQAILNSSGLVHIPPESGFIARGYPFFFNRTDFGPEDYRTLSRLFRNTSNNKGWGMSEEYISAYLETAQPQSFRDVFNSICAAYHVKNETQDLVWGIKRPALIANLDRIKNIYSEAKIIHVCRDGRDVYLSYKAVHEKSPIKFGPKGLMDNALYWIDGLRRVEEFSDTYKGSNIFEVRYEDILKSPDLTLEKISNFIGIKSQDSIVDQFNERRESSISLPGNLTKTIHAKVLGKIDPNNTCKYLKNMSDRKILLFELITSKYLKKYGYDLKYQFLNYNLFSLIMMPIFHLARLINDFRYYKRDIKLFASATPMYKGKMIGKFGYNVFAFRSLLGL